MFLNRFVSLFGITSVKGRLRLSFIIFLILLVGVGSFPLALYGKEQRLVATQTEIEKIITVQQSVLNNWLDEQLADMSALAGLPIFKEKDIVQMEETLKVFNENHLKYNSLVYINEAGKIEVDTDGLIGLDVSEQPFFQASKAGQAYITDVIIDERVTGPIVIFSAPIHDRANEFQGLVLGEISIEIINEIMLQFTDDTKEVYLIDKNGMLITESRQGEFGEKINTELYRTALGENDMSEFYEANNGDVVFGDYEWVHDKQWLIVGEVKKNTIYGSYYDMIAFLSLGLIILGIVGWVIIAWMSSQIELPIRSVLAATRKIGKGKWGYRLSSTEYETEAREFQELRENFNHMSELIESNIKDIEKSEERFRMIAEYSSDMITIHDSLGNFLYVSPAGKEILQYEDHEVIGHDSYEFIHPDDIETFQNNLKELILTGYVVCTYRIRKKDSSYIWFESSVKSLEAKNYNEPQVIAISRNVTERKLAEQQLREANNTLHELSMRDGLLGIWNRRAFDEHFEKEWHRSLRNSTPLSVLILDVDYFKAYNDTYGHRSGDACLKQVATAISETTKRSGDMVFRYGGEEFSVILTETDHDGARKVAENIRKAVIDLEILHIGSPISEYVTLSVGVNTVIPKRDVAISQMIEGADQALYNAKHEGRNRVRSYDELPALPYPNRRLLL